jgi:hypothetical protein
MKGAWKAVLIVVAIILLWVVMLRMPEGGPPPAQKSFSGPNEDTEFNSGFAFP